MSVVSRSMAAVVIAAFALVGASAVAAAPAARVKHHAIVGTLEKVEGQNLTVKTKKGTETVTLASGATIHQGAKTLSTSDLSGDTGSRVKVRYTEQNGQKEAQAVTVSTKLPHSASTASASKKHS